MATFEPQTPMPTCPSCGHVLSRRPDSLQCPACSETVQIVDGIPHFPVDVDHDPTTTVFDALAWIYETPLWFPAMYRLIAGSPLPVDDRKRVAELLGGGDGDHVLDMACGTGRFTRHVAPEVATVWGIDVSEGMLQRAHRYADRSGIENVRFARMDATDPHFEDGTFDRVACCWALHLFEDVPGTLEEVYRVLTPEGRFAGATLSEAYLLTVPGLQHGLRRTVGARVFEPEKLRASLSEAGFTSIEFDRRGAALFFRADKE